MEPDHRPDWVLGMPECNLEHCPAWTDAPQTLCVRCHARPTHCRFDARIETEGGNVYCQRAIERMRDTLVRVAGVLNEDDAADCLEAAGEVPP